MSSGVYDEVILRDMPDPMLARESKWLPFLRTECKAGPDTIIVGEVNARVWSFSEKMDQV